MGGKDERNRKCVLIANTRGLFHCGISGIIPWNSVPGKACGPILENICNTNEVQPCNLCKVFTSTTLRYCVINNSIDILEKTNTGRGRLV